MNDRQLYKRYHTEIYSKNPYYLKISDLSEEIMYGLQQSDRFKFYKASYEFKKNFYPLKRFIQKHYNKIAIGLIIWALIALVLLFIEEF